MPLKVGVIGAGIAGLSAAIGLRRAGAEVEVFEQSTFKNETGAAITITPNGTRVLDTWGFDHQRAQATQHRWKTLFNGVTLDRLQDDDQKGVPQKYGHGLYFYHRQDLHTELRILATELSKDGKDQPVKMHLGSKTVSVDCDSGTLTLESGREVQKDLIVVADGVHSHLTPMISKAACPLQRGIKSVFRTLIPLEDIYQDPELGDMWKTQPSGFRIFVVGNDETKDIRLVTYPCRSLTLLNVAILHPAHKEDEDKEDWHATADRDRALSVLEGFNPLVQRIISKAPVFNVHKTFVRDPLENLVNGKVVVIGDAAHPVYPTYAQGAVLSIEEGGALEVFFRDVVDSGEVESRLKLYQDLMLSKVRVVQLKSNFGSHEEAVRWSKKPLFKNGGLLFSPEVADYFYTIDVAKEATQMLADAKHS